ncbi:isopropylmalate isomerase small subunit [Caballeronia sordidicola]|uniref:Isopropylmalate isomerase small subunit n=1 Tax=Caballeronia sordidicola TaxID=196367 RepID=A0A158I621_CABSO|nr:isopropylmalate isomerase small subunit [Caballeronia sordidicola]
MIAASFADIFFNNCCRNGILPVVLEEAQIRTLRQAVEDTVGFRLGVDLTRCEVNAPSGERFQFNVPEALRTNLLQGVDEVGATLAFVDEIRAFEQARLADRPWL